MMRDIMDVPYARALDMRVHDNTGIAPVIIMPFADKVQGRPGYLHGGAISGLLENTAWLTVLDALPDGARLKPITVTVDFMRGAVANTETDRKSVV